MSNKQNFATNLIDDWQRHMQEYFNDPRVAELMMDYYAKFQDSIQGATKDFTNQSTSNASNDAVNSNELLQRIKILETRLEFLEKLMAAAFKTSE